MRQLHSLVLRTLTVAAIVLPLAAGSVFGQAPSQSTNPALTTAIELLNERKSKEAVKALKRVVEKNVRDADAWYYLGVAYLQVDEFKKASDAFLKTINLQPQYAAQAHAGYGYALMRRGKLTDASAETQKALAADPKNTDALHTMSLISVRAGKREDALKYADAVIALKPDFAEAYLVKSQAHVRFTFDAVVENRDQPKEDRKASYKAAADALEQYLKFAKSSSEKQLWKDQLESLRFYAGERADVDDSAKVYRSRDVTTKVKLLSKPEPSYTQAARSEWVNGTVVLRCVFAGDGTIKHILILESLPRGLTEVAVAAAKRIKFVPATLNGKPVSTYMQLEYNFNLF